MQVYVTVSSYVITHLDLVCVCASFSIYHSVVLCVCGHCD